MEPTYKQGDHVLTFNWMLPQKNQVIVYFDGRFYIKRIKSTKNNLVEICGDNKKMSAQMKPIEKSKIVGRVILKY